MKEIIKEIGVVEFLTKQFPDEQSAVDFFIEKRWGDQVTCPYCGSIKVYKGQTNQPFKCGDCNNKFTAKTGTIMEGSKVPVRIWLLAMYIMGTSRKGVSSIQLAKQLGVTQKTAWFMAHRIREACENVDKLKGIIEIDEVYIGGKERNKHYNKRVLSGRRGSADKIAIVGLRERNGRTIAKIVKSTGARVLREIIAENVMPGSAVFTDDFGSYRQLAKMGYHHSAVNHSQEEYVRGIAHTNSTESFWALLKRGLYGTYHSVSRNHLQRYVNEFAFRSADMPTLAFVNAVCDNANGNVLGYKQLCQNKDK